MATARLVGTWVTLRTRVPRISIILLPARPKATAPVRACALSMNADMV
jgi:hypothetical protein